MKWIRVLLVLAIGAVGIGVVVVERAASSQQVYTPAEVQQGRLSQPAAWAGHTVQVRGRLLSLRSNTWGLILPPLRRTPCGLPRRSVMYAASVSRRQSLVVVAAQGVAVQTSTPFVPASHDTLLRAVLETVACWPVVGRLVPASAVEQGMTLRVRVVPVRRCAAPISRSCPDAVLLGISR